ncbi:MAG: hypothetical protein IH595_02030 [Bacteroidales bacterium]|nr:hypothetical protein [Bacteroidales bacterium]
MFFSFLKNVPLRGKYSFLVIFILLKSSYILVAQDLLLPKGARSAGMGQCSVALTGFWNINDNQAGMALVKDFSAGINYQERFGMGPLSTKSIAVLYPSHLGVLGASIDYFGYSLYHEAKFGLAYARFLSPNLRAGVKLDYFQTGYGDHYGSDNNLTFELGFQYDISRNLTLGGSVFDPVPKSNFRDVTFKLPFVYQIGVAYRFSKSLLATVEIERNSELSDFELKAGMEYSIENKYFFRTGLGTMQEIFTIGFGYKLKDLWVDIAAVVHQTLGISPQVSLIYSFGL